MAIGPTVEEFYAQPQRRHSREVRFGNIWMDATGRRYELSWIEATGEIYAMVMEFDPVNYYGDDGTVRTRRGSPTVRVLGKVASEEELNRVLAGWEDWAGAPGGIEWAQQQLNRRVG